MKMQESYRLVKRFWDRPVCILALVPQKNCAWMSFAPNLKSSVNHRQMKSDQGFDLLTSFRQGDHSVDEWYNAVQAQIILAKYPPETANILHRDAFWFFLRDAEFV